MNVMNVDWLGTQDLTRKRPWKIGKKLIISFVRRVGIQFHNLSHTWPRMGFAHGIVGPTFTVKGHNMDKFEMELKKLKKQLPPEYYMTIGKIRRTLYKNRTHYCESEVWYKPDLVAFGGQKVVDLVSYKEDGYTHHMAHVKPGNKGFVQEILDHLGWTIIWDYKESSPLEEFETAARMVYEEMKREGDIE